MATENVPMNRMNEASLAAKIVRRRKGRDIRLRKSLRSGKRTSHSRSVIRAKTSIISVKM